MNATIAYSSDLHVGRERLRDAAAERLVGALLGADVDVVVVTGDVTHRGRRAGLADLERICAPAAHEEPFPGMAARA